MPNIICFPESDRNSEFASELQNEQLKFKIWMWNSHIHRNDIKKNEVVNKISNKLLI